MAAGDVLYATGFEFGSATYQEWFASTSGGTVAVSSTFANNGTYSLRINRTSANTCYAYWDWDSTQTPVLPGTYRPTTLSLSLWFRVATLPSATSTIVGFGALTYNSGLLELSSSGELSLRFGTEGSGTSVATGITTGTWYHVEFGVDFSTTTHKIHARLDGGTDAERTIAQAGTDVCYAVWLGNATTSTGTWDLYFDDLVLTEGYSAWPGQLECHRLLPSGDIDSNWTISGGDSTRAAAVDDVPEDTGTYIFSTTASQSQAFDLGTYTLGTDESFVGLAAWGVAGGNGTTARNLTIRFADSSATDHGTSATWLANVNGFQICTEYYGVLTAPSGGALSQSEIDGLRIRIQKNTGTRHVRLADVHALAVVKYTPSTTETQALTAGLSFTSAQAITVEAVKTAALSFTSAQTKQVGAAKTGTLSFTSAQTKAVSSALAGALSFTSAQAKKAASALAGALSFTGALTPVEVSAAIQKALTATLSFSSAQTRKVTPALAAGLSFTSSQAKKVSGDLAAGLSFTSAQARKVALSPLTAALSFTSAQAKSVGTTLSGALSFSGGVSTVVTALVQQALTATLSFTSAQTKAVSSALTATLGFTSAQAKAVSSALTATLGFTSAQAKAVSSALTATLGFTSAQTKKVGSALAGALSFAGGVSNGITGTVRQYFEATLSFTSAQTKAVSAAISAVLSFVGLRTVPGRRYGGGVSGAARASDGSVSGSTRGSAGSAGSGSGRQ